MSALATAREVCPQTPFIFVSGTVGEQYAIRASQNGAADYVLKTNLVRLPAAVERAVREARERDERDKAKVELGQVHERLHCIFATLADVLWSVALPDRKIIYMSPAIALVELQGGTVRAESDGHGKGSQFTVTLPRMQEAEMPGIAMPAEASGSHPGADRLKVLIVDDNEDAAQMLALMIGALGHETMVDHNPLRALERIGREPADVYLLVGRDVGVGFE